MKKVVTFGEIMLRLAAPGNQRFCQADRFDATFGGGEANVAVSLANYGYVAQFVTRMPENDLAAACLMDLHKYGVRTDHVVFGGERLGIYFLETGAVSRPGKVVYDRAHSSMAGIRPGMIDWERVFEGASWFHWTGITPAISAGAAEACREAVEAANRMQVPVSCDLNYRDKLWKYGKTAAEVMPRLVAGCDVRSPTRRMPRRSSVSNPRVSTLRLRAAGSTVAVSGMSAAGSWNVSRVCGRWPSPCAGRSTRAATPGAGCSATDGVSTVRNVTTSRISSIVWAAATPLPAG